MVRRVARQMSAPASRYARLTPFLRGAIYSLFRGLGEPAPRGLLHALVLCAERMGAGCLGGERGADQTLSRQQCAARQRTFAVVPHQGGLVISRRRDDDSDEKKKRVRLWMISLLLSFPTALCFAGPPSLLDGLVLLRS